MASSGTRRTGLMVAALLMLGGCQSGAPVPEPVVAAPPPPPAKVVQRAARPKRVEPACKTAAELTAARKEALFRKFAAMQDKADDAVPVSVATPATPACRNTAG